MSEIIKDTDEILQMIDIALKSPQLNKIALYAIRNKVVKLQEIYG